MSAKDRVRIKRHRHIEQETAVALRELIRKTHLVHRDAARPSRELRRLRLLLYQQMVALLCQGAAGAALAARLHLPAQDVPIRPAEGIGERVLLLAVVPAEGDVHMVHHILQGHVIGGIEVQPVTDPAGVQLRAEQLPLDLIADAVELKIQRAADAMDLLREHQIPPPQIPAVGQHRDTHRLIPPSTGPLPCCCTLGAWSCWSFNSSRISRAWLSSAVPRSAAHAR